MVTIYANQAFWGLQAAKRRQRVQAIRPPNTITNPGSPAPATGPGTAATFTPVPLTETPAGDKMIATLELISVIVGTKDVLEKFSKVGENDISKTQVLDLQ